MLSLLGVHVVCQPRTAPHIGVFAPVLGQSAHDGLGSEHVAPQLLVGNMLRDQSNDLLT